MTAQPHRNQEFPVFGPGQPGYEEWESEVKYFQDNRMKFWNQPELRSKFIALLNHKIVDKDDDEFVLATRVSQQHPHEMVVISKVELTDRIINLPDMRFR